jgi:RNA polymerase sigma-70 factor (ECF subfamily)
LWSRYQIRTSSRAGSTRYCASYTAEAPDHAGTDWPQIRVLYSQLDELAPSPVVRLNRAVATRYSISPQAALAEVDELADTLAGYRLFHAVRGELLEALGRTDEARQATERALALATNPAASCSLAAWTPESLVLDDRSHLDGD